MHGKGKCLWPSGIMYIGDFKVWPCALIASVCCCDAQCLLGAAPALIGRRYPPQYVAPRA